MAGAKTLSHLRLKDWSWCFLTIFKIRRRRRRREKTPVSSSSCVKLSLSSLLFSPWLSPAGRDVIFSRIKNEIAQTHTHLFVTPSFHQSIRERKSVEREKDNYWGISSNLLCNLRHLISIKTKYIIRIFIVLGFFSSSFFFFFLLLRVCILRKWKSPREWVSGSWGWEARIQKGLRVERERKNHKHLH